MTTRTFSTVGYTNFTVPAGCTSIAFSVKGGGGNPDGSTAGGRGGHVGGNCSVTPGHVLQMRVGGQRDGHYGQGGAGGAGHNYGSGHNGGAATWVYDTTASQWLFIAGGGGGASGDSGYGGNGGGGNGGYGNAGSSSFVTNGKGGHSGSGGAGGDYYGGSANTQAGNGESFTYGGGGNGGSSGGLDGPGGGGGGGGWGGGGGGGGGSDGYGCASGGGGGDNYNVARATSTYSTTGGAASGGDGSVYISYTANRAPGKTSISGLSHGEYTGWYGAQGSVTATATDPDGNNVRFQAQVWENNNYDATNRYSSVTGWVASGAPKSVSISFYGFERDVYYVVRVRAEDSNGAWGPWSDSYGFWAVRTPYDPSSVTPVAATKTGSTGSQSVSAYINSVGASPNQIRALFRLSTVNDLSHGYVNHFGAWGGDARTTSLTITGLAQNTRYYLWVYCQDKTGIYSGYTQSNFYTNLPPDKPTLSSPADSASLDGSVTHTFEWTWSDTEDTSQSAAQFEFKKTTDNNWNTRSISGSTLSYTSPVNTFISNETYQWRVKTQDSGGLWSPYSAIRTFTVQGPPVASDWSSPDFDSIQDPSAAITVEWIFSDPDTGDTQSSADIQYREVGQGDWTSILNASTDTTASYIFAADTLTAGKHYEIQVKTYDVLLHSSPWSKSLFIFTTSKSTMRLVQGASVQLSTGDFVEVRSDGAASPTLSLYSITNDGATVTKIADLDCGTGASDFAVTGAWLNAVALAVDSDDNLYVAGRQGASGVTLIAQQYTKGTGLAWTAETALTQAMPNNASDIQSLAMDWSDTSDPGHLLVVAFHEFISTGKSAQSYTDWAVLDCSTLDAGSGVLFADSGKNPSWAPTSKAGDVAHIDCVELQGGTDNSFGIAMAFNDTDSAAVTPHMAIVKLSATGQLSVTYASTSGGATDTGIAAVDTRVQAVALGAGQWAALYPLKDVIGMTLVDAGGSGTAYSTTSRTDLANTLLNADWAAIYDRANNSIWLYYIDSAATRTVNRIQFSMSGKSWNATEDEVTTTFGDALTTNKLLRVPKRLVDERYAIVTGGNDDA